MDFENSNLFLTTSSRRSVRPPGKFDVSDEDEERSKFLACIQFLILCGDLGKSVGTIGIHKDMVDLLELMFPHLKFTRRIGEGDLFISHVPIKSRANIAEVIYKNKGIGKRSTIDQVEKADEEINRLVALESMDNLASHRRMINTFKPKAFLCNFSISKDTEFFKGIPIWGLYTTDLWLISKDLTIGTWNFEEIDSYLYYHNAVTRSNSYKNVLSGKEDEGYYEGAGNDFDKTAEMFIYTLYHSLTDIDEDVGEFAVRMANRQ